MTTSVVNKQKNHLAI